MEVEDHLDLLAPENQENADQNFTLNLNILDDYELPEQRGSTTETGESSTTEQLPQNRAKRVKRLKLEDSTGIETGPEKRGVLGDDYREQEERRLEQLLFGKLFPKTAKDSKVDKEAQELKSSEDEADEESNDDEETSNVEEVLPSDKFGKALGLGKSNEKKPAWTDADDETIKLKDVVATYKRGAGRHGEKETSETNYQQILKKNFASVHGQVDTPKWARLDAKKVSRKSKRAASESEEENETLEDDSLLQTATDFISHKLVTLPRGVLDFKRVKDVNHMTRGEGAIIKAVEFHKKENVALVAGLPGIVSLFQVDGRTNSKIQTVHFDKFPISCARFSSEGNEFIATSHLQGHINVYDMVSGRVSVIPHNKSIEKGNMKLFSVSPDGKILAFQGRLGYVHLMAAKSKEWITSLKMNGQVNAFTFSPDGSRLYTHGEFGEVYVWDMNTRQCVHKFVDEGCINGTSIAISPTQQYVACGSSSGVVNVYDTASLENQMNPKPSKVFLNLVTTASSLKFHPSAEMMCMASDVKDNAVRLVHFPSMTVFQNFPLTQNKTVHQVKSCDFSPNGGYLAMSNNKGSAMLFRLQHYKEY